MSGGSSGSQTSTSKQEPWGPQQGYLKRGFQEAQRQFNTGGPSMYGGALVAPFAPETQQAMGMQAARAQQGSPLTQTAKDYTGRTIGGQYLDNQNPWLGRMYDTAAQRVTDQFNQEVVPGLQSRFARAGRTGSGAETSMADRATGRLTDSLSSMAAQIYGPAYEAERGRQEAAIGRAPGLAATDYGDIAALGQVGAQREAMGQRQIAEAAQRHDFEQNRALRNLQSFQAATGGSYGGQETQSQPIYNNPLGGAASGALLGYGMDLGWPGALLGAGAGYFGS